MGSAITILAPACPFSKSKKDSSTTSRIADSTKNSTVRLHEKILIKESIFTTTWVAPYVDGSGCVCKWFKPEYKDISDIYFRFQDKIYSEVFMILDDWNNLQLGSFRFSLLDFQIISSEVEDCLVEMMTSAFIANMRKMNSNTGWLCQPGDIYNDAAQALSHFSFHSTGGTVLLCDLQGG
jgi:hypothetical protein